MGQVESFYTAAVIDEPHLSKEVEKVRQKVIEINNKEVKLKSKEAQEEFDFYMEVLAKAASVVMTKKPVKNFLAMQDMVQGIANGKHAVHEKAQLFYSNPDKYAFDSSFANAETKASGQYQQMQASNRILSIKEEFDHYLG